MQGQRSARQVMTEHSRAIARRLCATGATVTIAHALRLMRKSLIPLLIGGLAAGVVDAPADEGDDMPIYNGTWSVQLDAQRSATVTLQDWDGTWKERATARSENPACRGKSFPITIQHSTSSVLEFTAWRATVAPACPNVGLSVKPVDPRTLEGTTDAGIKVRLTRVARH